MACLPARMSRCSYFPSGAVWSGAFRRSQWGIVHGERFCYISRYAHCWVVDQELEYGSGTARELQVDDGHGGIAVGWDVCSGIVGYAGSEADFELCVGVDTVSRA